MFVIYPNDNDKVVGGKVLSYTHKLDYLVPFYQNLLEEIYMPPRSSVLSLHMTKSL